MSPDPAPLAASTLAELLVAWVIYCEFEGSRLDQFLADSDLFVKDREALYKSFCELSDLPLDDRRRAFKERLESGKDGDLLKSCHQTIRLVSRIGARVPTVRWLRRTPIDWHVAALLWIVLGPYVQARRREAGPSYAESFLKYALASTKRLLSQKRDAWLIRDPDRSRKCDVRYAREDLLLIKEELRSEIKRKG